jgi:hypothetical protein
MERTQSAAAALDTRVNCPGRLSQYRWSVIQLSVSGDECHGTRAAMLSGCSRPFDQANS